MTWLLVTRPTSPLPSLAKLSLRCHSTAPTIPPTPTLFYNPDKPCRYLVCSAQRRAHARPFLNPVRRDFQIWHCAGWQQTTSIFDGWINEQTGSRKGEGRKEDSEKQQLQEEKWGAVESGAGMGCKIGEGGQSIA